MQANKLYFIKDSYFKQYKSDHNKPNKREDNESRHKRPCYYAFCEGEIYWMIPISSQCEKYEKVYQKSIDKYGVCDSIVFGYVKGNKNAFLIQNMIPVSEKYIDSMYTYGNTDIPVEVNSKKQKEINAKARKILRFSRNGKKMTFTPILQFEKQLLEEIKQDTSDRSVQDKN